MSTIGRRIAALEAEAGVGAERVVVTLVSFRPGPLTGYRIGDQVVRRREAESEEELQDRAIAEASVAGDVLVLREVRDSA